MQVNRPRFARLNERTDGQIRHDVADDRRVRCHPDQLELVKKTLENLQLTTQGAATSTWRTVASESSVGMPRREGVVQVVVESTASEQETQSASKGGWWCLIAV